MRNKFYLMDRRRKKFTPTETVNKLKFIHIDPFWNKLNLSESKVKFKTMRCLSQTPAYKLYKKRKKE